MEIRRNAGYTITDSIHIGKAEFVLGVFPTAPAPYVTWECKDGNNYFWGHYFSDVLEAKKDLLERAGMEIKMEERRQERQTAPPQEKERER